MRNLYSKYKSRIKLQEWRYIPSNKAPMIPPVNFTYYPLGETPTIHY